MKRVGCPRCGKTVLSVPSDLFSTPRLLETEPSPRGELQIVHRGRETFSRYVDRRRIPPGTQLYPLHDCTTKEVL